MKNLILIPILIFSLIFTSCTSDDDTSNNDIFSTIRFEVTISENRDTEIITKINNQSEVTINPVFPFTEVHPNVSLNSGTFLELTYSDETPIVIGDTFSYDLTLSILINNEVVKTEMFTNTETTTSNRSINYVIP